LLVVVLSVSAVCLQVGPVSAASEVCDDTGSLCVSAGTLTPSTISNANDTTVTITVTLSRGGAGCLDMRWFSLPNGGAPSTNLTPVATGSQVYQGTMTVFAGTQPGQYSMTDLGDCGGYSIDGGPLAAVGLGPITITGTADTTPPSLAGLTVGATSADATYGNVAIPVTMSATDDFSGARSVYVVATPVTVPPEFPDSPRSKPVYLQDSVLSQGSITNGTWTGTLPLAGGSATVWKLSAFISDRVGNDLTLTSEQLAARGLPAQITTRTTAAPPRPTNVRATSSISYYGGWNVLVQGDAQQAGKPVASEWAGTSAGACGAVVGYTPGAVQAGKAPGRPAGICSVTVRAVNAAGVSAPVTVYAILGP
jgi:hypothetical protein